MKILVDTNVLISAIVFDGRPEALLKVLGEKGHTIFITSYVESEFLEKMNQKWPEQSSLLRKIFYEMRFLIYESTDKELGEIRDKKDMAVLSDAIYYDADIILTGDKDFLESGYKSPRMLSVSALWDELGLDG